MVNIDSMFELAIELRDKGELRDSINVLTKVLCEYPLDKRTHAIYSVLGGIYGDLQEYDMAFANFKLATELNPSSELASLGLYVTLATLEKDEEAIRELIRYLTSYPAKLYMVTLEELLEGLGEGYMTDYRNDIMNLARKNGIEL